MRLRHVDVTPPDDAVGAPCARLQSDGESLLSRLDALLGTRYTGFVIVLAVSLALLLVLAGYLQGRSRPLAVSGIWMLGLEPAILVYILAVHPLMHRRWVHAMRALEALARHARSAEPAKPDSRFGEWGAMLLGVLAGLLVARGGPVAAGWLKLYSEATSALMFALLASAIYGSMARSRHLAAFSREGLELKVFDGHLLMPFARWGQSLSLVFVGGISLSLLFQSYDSLRGVESAIIYGGLVVVAMTFFFMSMWTVHVALVRARDKELVKVRHDLGLAREALAHHPARDGAAALHDAYLPAVVLGLYEQQVLDAPTWPFNSAIVGRVFASVAAPFGVYLLKLAIGVGRGF